MNNSIKMQIREEIYQARRLLSSVWFGVAWNILESVVAALERSLHRIERSLCLSNLISMWAASPGQFLNLKDSSKISFAG
jgi:hypothetical protein